MYSPIWKSIRNYLSADRMQADIAEFFEFSRWSSFDKINGLAQTIAAKMAAIGMEDVKLIDFPADGKTAYCGWVMPHAYNVHGATLHLLEDGRNTVLADYHSNPTSLMLYSMSTPAEGVTAEIVVADSPDAITRARAAGKIVLTSGIGVEYSLAAQCAGAYGLVSDCRNVHAHFKNNREVGSSNEWHNYTIPPWANPDNAFGFSISPEKGRQLRSMLANGAALSVHAFVDTTHYGGILPVVSGRMRGEVQEEIVLTGHYDEYGADDNCSQIAVSLEVCRAIMALIDAKELPPLRRSIRILLPMEVRGFNALAQNNAEIRHIVAGLNIDTVGTDQNAATSSCTLSDSLAPSYADDFAAELLAHTARENPLFRWRRTPAEMIDNIFGEPMFGAPVPQIWHFSATHHLETDTPERISGPMLTEIARVAGTYAAFLANARLNEAIWLAELAAEHATEQFGSIARQALISNNNAHEVPTFSQNWEPGGRPNDNAALLRRLVSIRDTYLQKPATAGRLVPRTNELPVDGMSTELVKQLTGDSKLLPAEQFKVAVEAIREQIINDYALAEARVLRRQVATLYPDVSASPAPGLKSRIVPLKLIRGFLGFEDLTPTDLAFVRGDLQIPEGWGAPMWLQHALMYANGKRTAGEIACLLERRHECTIELTRIEAIFTFLAERGVVRLRPYVTQADVKRTLSAVGIAPGSIVLGHFALSWFGFIEGGADALISTILEMLGPAGTLVMPAFSFSWIGRLPYDAESTPSVVGAVTNCFRTQPGVLRSAHPTHSFAARGVRAAEILAKHDHTKSPLSEDGPLAKLEALDAKILMFAPPNANTAMHLGEYRAGLPLFNFICPVVDSGIRREVVVPECPWHVQFEPAYELLYARNQVQEAPLGEQMVRVVRAADAIAAQAEVMHNTPELLLQPGCKCLYCTALMQYIAKRN